MESSNRYDELLVRYLFSEETAEEKVLVENWLKASEENQRYFNRLKKTWQLIEIKKELGSLIDEASLDERWDRFRQNIAERQEAKTVSIDEQKQSGGEYSREEKVVQKPSVYRLVVSAAVAASVLLLIGLGWKFFASDTQLPPVAQKQGRKPDSLQFVVRHEVNATGKEKTIQLADGSLIVLGNNSEITYREPFTNSRDIALNGKAYFKVAPDKKRPFTVTSGEISTTALGTEFTVTAYQNANRIIVRLYEGKVVIKAFGKANKKMNNDVYLLPGQEFVYGNEATAKVKAFKIKSAAPEQIMKEEKVYDNPLLPKDVDAPWFMFNNQPLAQVLDYLTALYNVEIVYDKKDVQNIYFTSKYDKRIPLETILRQICTPNHLTVTKKDSAFYISR